MYGVYSKFTSTPNCNEDIFNRAIAHEPSAEFDEHSFVPERFLAPNVSTPDPAKWAFGFGRRSGNSLEMYLFFADNAQDLPRESAGRKLAVRYHRGNFICVRY